MSIEMDNPVTLLEKIDAAANLLGQVRLSLMMRDYNKADNLLGEAEQLLFQATIQAEGE